MGSSSSRSFGRNGNAGDDNLDYELISNESDNSDSADSTFVGNTILQFTAALYFVEEFEGAVILDVMRLGDQAHRSTCYFHTEDMTGRHGERFEATEGLIVFEAGEHEKSIEVPLIVSQQWRPTLEFKVVLSQATGCSLGQYLHTCRVKVIDDEFFPSSKYPQVTGSLQEIARIGHSGLFWEYCKLNFLVEGIMTKTNLIIVFDQMKNAYTYYKLWAISYLLNCVFHDKAGETIDAANTAGIDQRTKEAFFIGLGYLVPMIALHVWDLVKAKIDLKGHSRSFLQKSIITKYLNYTLESRSEIDIAEVEIAVREDAACISDGYCAALELLRIAVKTMLLLSFVNIENSKAIGHVLLMLGLMLVFALLRSGALSKANDLPLAISTKVLSYIAEIGKNYRLIANYAQRPHANDQFDIKVHALRVAEIAPHFVRTNNDYFTKWLGPLFVGTYIITHSRAVLLGELRHGTFIATLNVFNEMSFDFSEGYQEAMKITSISGILMALTKLLNMPTDLLTWKSVNRARRMSTRIARQKIIAEGGVDAHSPFPTDLIPFEFKNVGYKFPIKLGDPATFLQGINLTVQQGSIVAVLGFHGQGRQTLLRLIAHELFPTEGSIFIPTHLRILHVSQEVYVLDSSVIHNITFGHEEKHMERIKVILQRLNATKILQEIEDYESRNNFKSAPTTQRSSDSQDSEADSEDGSKQQGGCCCLTVEEPDIKEEDSSWLKKLSYSEKAKLHLARALVMNPEVMVLQRPLAHFNREDRERMLALICEHVQNRGLCLPNEGMKLRRPRTVFMSLDDVDHADKADVVMVMHEPGSARSVTVKKEANPMRRLSGVMMSPTKFAF